MSTDQSTAPPDLCVVYVRVSDDKQSGASSQTTGARHMARLHGLEVLAEVADDGLSGDDLERAGLGEVLDLAARQHKAGRPVTWLLLDQSDRLSRADSLETSELLLKLRRLGVRKVATPARVFDLYDSLDRTLLQIEADHKNNPYLKDLARRVLNGMLDSARAGFWTGQKPPLGYVVVHTPGEHGGRRRRSGRLAIDPDTAPLVREAFERYLAGENTRDLARWLSARAGRPYRHQSLYHMLQNETYTGTRAFGRRARGRHARLVDGQAAVTPPGGAQGGPDAVRLAVAPPLIDLETFLAVKRRLGAGKARAQKKDAPLSPLSGLCRCGACGAVMRSARQGVYPYLLCRRRDLEGEAGCPTSGHARGEVVLRRVQATLAERLLAGDAVARLVALAGDAEEEAAAAWEAGVASARRALEATEAKLATARRRLAEAPEDLLDDYQRLLRELKGQKAACEADLARLRAEAPAPEGGDAELLTRWLELCRSVCREGPGGTPEQQNAVLKELVAEVRVWPAPGPRRGNTVGRVEVVLPEWLSRVLSTTASRGGQHASSIVLVSEPPAGV